MFYVLTVLPITKLQNSAKNKMAVNTKKKSFGDGGRQTQMNTREQMQAKSFYGWKKR
jgi:hypothetical protein